MSQNVFAQHLTDPENLLFQNPETRPFCEAAAAAFEQATDFRKAYETEKAKGDSANAGRLAWLRREEIERLKNLCNALELLTGCTEKEISKLHTGGARLN